MSIKPRSDLRSVAKKAAKSQDDALGVAVLSRLAAPKPVSLNLKERAKYVTRFNKAIDDFADLCAKMLNDSEVNELSLLASGEVKKGNLADSDALFMQVQAINHLFECLTAMEKAKMDPKKVSPPRYMV